MDLDDDFDFGFSSVGENDLENKFRPPEPVLDGRADMMYKAIIPLLDNLAKDADKNAYIHWPNRTAKIDAFKNKLKNILNS